LVFSSSIEPVHGLHLFPEKMSTREHRRQCGTVVPQSRDAFTLDYALEQPVTSLTALCYEMGIARKQIAGGNDDGAAHSLARRVFSQYRDADTPWSLTPIDQDTSTKSMVRESALWYFTALGAVSYVRVVEGRLYTVWAYNEAYINWWNEPEAARGDTFRQMYDEAAILAGYRPGGAILPPDRWTANGHILRMYSSPPNVSPQLHWWMDMLSRCNLPDCEFLLNAQDFPRCPVDQDAMPWGLPVAQSKRALRHLPFRPPLNLVAPFSSCTAPLTYADRLIPTRDDWALRHRYGTTECPEVQLLEEDEDDSWRSVPWSQRDDRAVFRGTATGSGSDATSNLRLKAVAMSRNRPDLLDAGITKWTSTMRIEARNGEKARDRPVVDRTRPPPCRDPTAALSPFVDIEVQARRYKFVLSLDGHVAAFRLSSLLATGALVLKPASKWKVWYERDLVPMVHYVPVAEDLSNLCETIEWCKARPELCERIVYNAVAFAFRTFSEANIQRYTRGIVEKHASPLHLNEPREERLTNELQTRLSGVEYADGGVDALLEKERNGRIPTVQHTVEGNRPNDQQWNEVMALWRTRYGGRLPLADNATSTACKQQRVPQRELRDLLLQPLSKEVEKERPRQRKLYEIFSPAYSVVAERWRLDSPEGARRAFRWYQVSRRSGLSSRGNKQLPIPRFLHAQRVWDASGRRGSFVVWREFVRGSRLVDWRGKQRAQALKRGRRGGSGALASKSLHEALVDMLNRLASSRLVPVNEQELEKRVVVSSKEGGGLEAVLTGVSERYLRVLDEFEDPPEEEHIRRIADRLANEGDD
jgi:Glycosyl transferase family 90